MAVGDVAGWKLVWAASFEGSSGSPQLTEATEEDSSAHGKGARSGGPHVGGVGGERVGKCGKGAGKIGGRAGGKGHVEAGVGDVSGEGLCKVRDGGPCGWARGVEWGGWSVGPSGEGG